ncbi:MAG: peptide chain release factor aRF-1 [Candidatus Nanoarchaeia archaeon]|nr:peptide chain release factor aRF-1 [Candidatus Nanoarchaeia archaeon]MDD5054492.1 peptide chain release factor aRF-1 [Candidatus Nanoarchaeia archaeon]MDD5499935.1 peptide chain release factor aRF-1 [Candidatus Nanoarchaeia archaeon]
MSLSPEKAYELRKIIKRLEKARASATELVSLYIPAGFDINTAKSQLTSELSLSSNIKSKQTRKAVLASIEKASAELKKYVKTPDNGLIVFTGDLEQNPNKMNVDSFVLDELPMPLSIRIYRTENRFILEPLKDMIEEKNVFALICMDNNDAAIAVVKGSSMKTLAVLDSMVPGKMRAGGQSAARFSRVRVGLMEAWYEEVAKKANEVLLPIKELKGIIVGGPSQAKNSFLDEPALSGELKKKVLGALDIGYAGEDGLKELLDKSEEILSQESIIIERKIIQEFFGRLAKDDKVAYGKKEVVEAINLGAAQKVLIIESMPEELIDEIIELSKNFNTEVVLVSEQTPEGEQLKMMGGIGAFLRYNLS